MYNNSRLSAYVRHKCLKRTKPKELGVVSWTNSNVSPKLVPLLGKLLLYINIPALNHIVPTLYVIDNKSNLCIT